MADESAKRTVVSQDWFSDERAHHAAVASVQGSCRRSPLGFTFDTGAWLALLPWFVAAGVGIGFVETAEHAAVAGAAPTDLRGSAFGLLAGVQSFGNLAASAVAGLLWSAFSPSWAFAYLAAWMVLALILFVAVRAPSSWLAWRAIASACR